MTDMQPPMLDCLRSQQFAVGTHRRRGPCITRPALVPCFALHHGKVAQRVRHVTPQQGGNRCEFKRLIGVFRKDACAGQCAKEAIQGRRVLRHAVVAQRAHRQCRVWPHHACFAAALRRTACASGTPRSVVQLHVDVDGAASCLSPHLKGTFEERSGVYSAPFASKASHLTPLAQLGETMVAWNQ